MTDFPVHISVLPQEVVAAFSGMPDELPLRLIDGTLGNGGHSKLLLETYPQLQILGIDRDEAALERASQNLSAYADRIMMVQGVYADLGRIAKENHWQSVDGVLLDIGVSSPQLDEPGRGFSWRQDGPLDMRMDRSQELTASRVVNRYSEAELARIFYEYGEIRSARKLAAAIAVRRTEQPFARTLEFAEFCEAVLGRSRPGSLPLPTLIFQALRIEVNGELEQLRQGLTAALEMLRPGGRLAVISFHSLEDRVVKQFMKEKAANCICPPGLPVCCCHHQSELKILSHGVISATPLELEANRRAASAKLRTAEKTDFCNVKKQR